MKVIDDTIQLESRKDIDLLRKLILQNSDKLTDEQKEQSTKLTEKEKEQATKLRRQLEVLYLSW